MAGVMAANDDSRRLVVYYDEEKNLVSGKSSLGLKVFALSCSGYYVRRRVGILLGNFNLAKLSW